MRGRRSRISAASTGSATAPITMEEEVWESEVSKVRRRELEEENAKLK